MLWNKSLITFFFFLNIINKVGGREKSSSLDSGKEYQEKTEAEEREGKME